MRHVTITILLGAIVATGHLPRAASPPDRLNYQGLLQTSSGMLVDGSKDIVLRFFDADVFGDELLVDAHEAGNGDAVDVASGVFNVELGGGAVSDGSGPGSYTSLAAVFRDHDEVWMAVEVDGEVLVPRARVLASAYALNADHLDGRSAGEFIDTSGTSQAKSGSLEVTTLNAAGNSVTLGSGDVFSTGSLSFSTGGQLTSSTLTLSGGGQLTSSTLTLPSGAQLSGSSLTLGGTQYGTSNIGFDSGAEISWNAAGLTVKSGGASSDTLFLVGGNTTDDGSITIVGDGSVDFRSGNGQFNFRAGATDNVTAQINAGGELQLDANLVLGTASNADNDSITFDGIETLLWDNAQTRFEFSDEVAASGPLSAGATAVAEVGYSRMGATAPTSGDIASTSDLMVSADLEVGSQIYAADIVSRDPAAGGGERTLQLRSTGTLAFMIDDENNSGSLDEFEWYEDGSFTNASQLAELQANGDFEIRGVFKASVTTFDLAERFLTRAPLEPGTVVGIDAERANGVVPVTRAYDPTVLGVVSSAPAIVIGGALFGVDDLDVWGAGLREEFLATESQWIDQAVAADGEVAALRDRLAELEAERAEPPARTAAEGENVEEPPDPTDEASRLEKQLRDAALERFASNRFVEVALTGRVPVLVDASAGAIRPGDYLTPSALTGRAMKAQQSGPIIGTALETLESGQGRIMAFVHRGAYSPGGASGATPPAPAADTTSVANTMRPETSAATGNLQVVLDRDADTDARFSIFADGDVDGSLGSEVFRVDEAGNVYARGSFRPASMDLAEYFPVSEPVEPGDVLVVDLDRPGSYRKGRASADPAVIGVVSERPGVLLGGGIHRIAAADPALSARLDEVRRIGNAELEAELWQELERSFAESHAAVALSGTTLVKVDAGFGSVRPGDLLVTSPTPGHAMRAADHLPGTVIGKALEALETGTGVVRALVSAPTR